MSTASRQHWPDIARQWERVGPPLRPSAEDIAVYTRVVTSWPAPRALILGVTPEIFGLPWPPGADVVAIDHTQAMIDAVWPGPPEAALCGEWTDMPLEPASRDIALCDGGLHLLSYPDAQRALVRDLGRVVAPGGLFVLRLFVPPVRSEPPEAVMKDLLSGRVVNVNVLKLRLGMALQRRAETGVELGSVWSALAAADPDPDHGWLAEIDSYRDSPVRYHFVTLDDVRNLFCDDPGGFVIESVTDPNYDLGERCPTVVMRRRDHSWR